MEEVLNKVKKHFEDEADEIMELRNDVLIGKTNLNMKVLATLLKKFIDTADELISMKESDNQMENMHESMKEMLSGIKEAMIKIKVPDVKPQITFDTSGIKELAMSIKEQNNVIINLLKEKPDDTYKKEILKIINEHHEYLGKMYKQPDYSDKLEKIAEALCYEEEEKPEKEEREIKELLIERNLIGRIEKIIPVYK